MSNKSIMRILLPFAVYGIAVAILGNFFSYAVYDNKTLDTAMLLDAVKNVREQGSPNTEILASAADAYHLFSKQWKDACEDPLIPLHRHDTGIELNVLKYHSYYFIYPLGWLSYLVTEDILLPYVNTAFFLLILLSVYLFCRSENLNRFYSALPALLVAVHPAWHMSMDGNLYMDRFFMPLALILTFYVYRKISRQENINLKILIPLALLAASTNDRSIIMLGVFTATTFALFVFKTSNKNRIILSATTLLLLVLITCYSFFIKDFAAFAQNSDAGYSSFKRLFQSQSFTHHLKSEFLNTYIYPFLLLNVVFFGFLMFFSGRWALVAIVSLLPNLFFTVGGAEKIGYLTHYHSQYFPFLIFSVVVGFVSIFKRKKQIAISLILLSIILTHHYDPNTRSLSLGTSFISYMQKVYAFYFEKERSSAIYSKAKWIDFKNKVPPNASVSTVEHSTTALYQQNTLFYFPMNIDKVDWIIPFGTFENDTINLGGAVNYHGQEKELNSCLLERIKRNGYQLNKEKSADGYLFFSRDVSASNID